MKTAEISPFNQQVKVVLLVILYAVIALNLVLIAQHWGPGYQGAEGTRFGGWAPDFAWLGLSSVVIFIAFLWLRT